MRSTRTSTAADRPLALGPALSPEAELLLCGARAVVSPAQQTRMGLLLDQELNWVDLIVMALRHGVLPLLTHSLSTAHPDRVPPETLADLQEQLAAHRERNQWLSGRLVGLLGELAEVGIPVLPFKGPTLAAAAYGNPALREFCDLDMLVRRDDVPAATELLQGRGWRLEGDEDRGSQYHAHLVEAASDLHVELHWGFTRSYIRFPLDLEQVWPRREPVELFGTTVYGMSAADLLLVLCLHGGRHDWRRLQWICDVAELVRSRPALDWSAVATTAASTGTQRMLHLGLLLAASLLDADIPEPLRGAMRADRPAAAAAAAIRQRLFCAGEETLGLRRRMLRSLGLRERWRDRLPQALHLARLCLARIR